MDPLRSHARLDSRGGSLVEYLLLLGLVGLVAIGGTRLFGHSVERKLDAQARRVETLTGEGSSAADPSGRPGGPRSRPRALAGVRIAAARAIGAVEDAALPAPPPPPELATAQALVTYWRGRQQRGQISMADLAARIRELGPRLQREAAATDLADRRVADAQTLLEHEARIDGLAPVARALRAADVAAVELDAGRGDVAARILDDQARRMRPPGARADPVTAALADGFEARAAAYRTESPRAGYEAAERLYRTASQARALAERSDGELARSLRLFAADSTLQARFVEAGAANTDVLLGQGVLATYRAIVDAAFARRIDDIGSINNFFSGRRERLREEQARMRVVFDELDRIMQQRGVSLDRAWNLMFDDRRMFLGERNPRPAGWPAIFVNRNDGAVFLRDHDVTRGQLMPFADLARSFSAGDAAGVDRARAELVRALRASGQWEIARAVLDQQLANAQTAQGRTEARRLDASERGEWWSARAGQFVGEELPILVLSGLVSGGAGWGARAIGLAAGWGTRAVRTAQVVTELAAFVPTERILSDAIAGRRADWSAGGLARDYALTIGGYGLFRALGRGWQALRARGRAPIGAFEPPGAGRTGVTLEDLTARGLSETEARALASQYDDLAQVARLIDERPVEAAARLRELAQRWPGLTVNWTEPIEITGAQLDRIAAQARELAPLIGEPVERVTEALAREEFGAILRARAGRTYCVPPGTTTPNVPRELVVRRAGVVRPLDPSSPAERVLAQLHARAGTEEFAHAAGFMVRGPGRYVVMSPRVAEFARWLENPRTLERLRASFTADEIAQMSSKIHEVDAMDLFVRHSTFGDDEVGRYAVRRAYEMFLLERSVGAPAAATGVRAPN